ncbi:thiamine biosynthesis lipoprotein [Planctomicrobium piriforme]|uniref:FAD:protein FMN transferase n=2 Tax=Planctomicrobium piriforme TaxID=1576369 RepID=A0A1I3G4X8_9PLAN|nr:thiamine biosynthesis lipoprotein [Planctomicrobium piriforme]
MRGQQRRCLSRDQGRDCFKHCFRHSLQRAVIALLLMTSPLLAENSPLSRHEFVQIRMGVPVRIVVYASDPVSAIQATDAAYERLKQLDRTLSDYDPDSELNQLCLAPTGTAVKVSPDLWSVLSASQKLSAQSDGAFDVTVGPLVKLWRVARRKKQLPDPADLAAAKKRVGFQHVTLDTAQQTVTLSLPEMQLDVGGIAKGYAADAAYNVLVEHGLPIALLAVAGDIRVGDPPPGRTGWRVEVEDRGRAAPPDHKPLVLELCRQAVSTSGDTYQYLQLNGVRYSHIVDSKTGLGLTTPGSVTVVAPTCMQADGLATALSILGPDRGFAFLEQFPHTHAMFVALNEQSEPVVRTSPDWNTVPTVKPAN